MDHDMGSGSWDDFRPPMRRHPRGSRGSQSSLTADPGMAFETDGLTHDEEHLGPGSYVMSASSPVEGWAPSDLDALGPIDTAGLTAWSHNGTPVTDRDCQQMQALAQSGGQQAFGQDAADFLSLGSLHSMRSCSIESTSPAISYTNSHIDGDCTGIDSLSSSLNYPLDSQDHPGHLHAYELGRGGPRNFSPVGGIPSISLPTQDGTGGAVGAAPYVPSNRDTRAQELEAPGDMAFSARPALALHPPSDDGLTHDLFAISSGKNTVSSLDWPVTHDHTSLRSSPRLSSPAIMDHSTLDVAGYTATSPYSDSGLGATLATKNVFNPNDFDLSSDYAMSGSSGTTVLKDMYTVSPEPQYLSVPSVPRRQSDPQPLRPEAPPHPLLRTLSTRSAEKNRPPSQSVRPRRASYVAPPSSAVGGSPVGPLRNPVKLPSPPPRGRRSGRLSDHKRREAHVKRVKKSTCIRCKLSKTACHPSSDDPAQCEKCQKVNPSSNKPFVCVRAHFLDLVLAGTTNYIAQYSINHLQRDLVRRRRIALPESVDFTKLVPLVQSLGRDHNIRVLQGTTALYEMDLRACHSYLAELCRTLPDMYSFQQFINVHLLKDDNWRVCIASPESLDEPLALLSRWNDMPSRITYSLTSRRGDHMVRMLDPDDSGDIGALQAAAQISRLVGRKVEVAAYSQLQNDMVTKPFSRARLEQLAEVLLSLRWRISWWATLGSGVAGPTAGDNLAAFADRVTRLCTTLYFYYFQMLRHAPAGEGMKRSRKKRYADTQCEVSERFPHDETPEGFDKWMADGRAMIREARAAEQLRVVGLAER